MKNKVSKLAILNIITGGCFFMAALDNKRYLSFIAAGCYIVSGIIGIMRRKDNSGDEKKDDE